MERFPFVAVEGLDGSGKTLLRKGLFRLWESLYQVTPLCILTTNLVDPALVEDLVVGKFRSGEADGERYAAALRADKRASLELLVRPHLRRRPVVADRWLLSDIAFLVVRQGLSVADAYRILAPGLSMAPDVMVLLDLPVQVAAERAGARLDFAARADWDNRAVQERVDGVYRQVAASAGSFSLLGEVVRLDAQAAPAELLYATWQALESRGLMPALSFRADDRRVPPLNP